MANQKIPKGYQGTFAKNSDGTSTLVMVSRHEDLTKTKSQKKEQLKMAAPKKQTGSTANANNFTPTFRKYSDMNKSEQDAFRQGASTVANKVKENLGLKQKKAS